MSIELKHAAEKALVVLGSATSFMSRKARDQHESVVAELRTAIQQAEAKTDEPVFFVSPAQARAVNGKNRCHYTPSDNSGRYLPVRATPAGLFTQPLYTHPAPGVPDGYVLVPVEPTDEMYEAGYDKLRDIHSGPFNGSPSLGHAGVVWRAMLTAAQAQKGGD